MKNPLIEITREFIEHDFEYVKKANSRIRELGEEETARSFSGVIIRTARQIRIKSIGKNYATISRLTGGGK